MIAEEGAGVTLSSTTYPRERGKRTGTHNPLERTMREIRRRTRRGRMDAYGHPLPGAETQTAAALGAMISLARKTGRRRGNILRMTGTDEHGAQHVAQQLGRETGRKLTAPCYGESPALDAGGRRQRKESGKQGRNAPLEHSVRLGTILSPPDAPLAQLAEQLTLNQ